MKLTVDENSPDIEWMTFNELEHHLFMQCKFEDLLGARKQANDAIKVAAASTRVGMINDTYVMSVRTREPFESIMAAARALHELTRKPVVFRLNGSIWGVQADD